MTVPAIFRLAPILTAREYQDPEQARPVMYDSARSLEPLNRSGDVPLVVNHDEDKVIGRVVEFYAADDAQGGRWIWARTKIDNQPSWLRVGSGVSFGSRTLSAVDRDGYRLVYRAGVDEVSVCSEDFEPVEPRARVWWIGKPEDSPAAARSTTSDRAAAGEVIHDYRPRDGAAARYAAERAKQGIVVRYGSGQVLGVR